MELTPYFIGAIVGALLASVFLYLLFKSKSIARKEYDALSSKHHEASTNLKLADERLRAQLELAATLQKKHDDKQLESSTLLSRIASLEASLKSNSDRLTEHTETINKERETNRNQQSEINLHQRQVSELRAQNVALLDKLEAQKNEIIEMQKTAHLQFEKLAQQIFEEKSGKFTETNKNNIEALLKPLSENIETFKKKVEETYDKESKQRFSLEEKVRDLIENTNRVSQEANNLASALKGQVKKQGDWGETILERILELSGLQKGREYYVQENVKDEEGNNLRPDIIVRLPENRNIVIDSKVSMNAYVRYTESETIEQQELCLAQHLAAIHNHIQDLSGKKYHDLVNSLNFVILFIPIEPAYMTALHADPTLSAYAYSKGIMLVSPHTLLGVLQIVADLWKREAQNKNAIAIAKQGTTLYEKFVGFVRSMEDIGKHITRSQDAYNDAMGQLKEGKGNLIRQAQNLKKLGIKSNKTKDLPAAFSTADDEEDELPALGEGQQAESED
jgi:DNA recombination protein RmuC